MKDLDKISILGTLLSKKYGKDIFKLLHTYYDISASEASSRLGLHVQTVQEFLELTAAIGLTKKKEVVEKKRPYFRYSLSRNTLDLRFDIVDIVGETKNKNPKAESVLLRERKNSHSNFTQARSGNFFSAVTVMEGNGRERSQKRINLTTAQGQFLFHLPFPDALPLSTTDIMIKAGIEDKNRSEVDDIVNELVKLKVIEKID